VRIKKKPWSQTKVLKSSSFYCHSGPFS